MIALLTNHLWQSTIDVALLEQLGLKLEKATGPGEFLVIDHIERPRAGGETERAR